MRTALASLALSALAGSALVSSAGAQDATWLLNPPTSSFTDAANWSTGTVPTGTAFFGISNVTTLTLSGPILFLGRMTLNADASDYTLVNAGGLSLSGGGITIAGGSLTILNNGPLGINNGSTAGAATIINNNFLQFTTGSNAGTANVTNTSVLVFTDSSAAAATITTSGTVHFQSTASGGTARFIQSGGTLEFGSLSVASTTVGSIEGTGTINLGSRTLTVGGNDLSTSYAGVIAGTGSLGKVGAGTLTLTGVSTYSGGTTISGGTLAIGNVGALGSGDVLLNGGILRSAVTGALANDIDVVAGSSGTITAANGQTLTLAGDLTIGPSATALRFGEAGGTGIVELTGSASFTGPIAFTIDVLGGTLRGTSSELGILTTFATATSVAAGSTLEFLGPSATAVRNLQSAGTVALGADVTIGGGLSTGVITGAGGLTVAAPGSFPLGNSGVLILAGANGYTGGTIIDTGATLRLGNGGASGSILGNVLNRGTLAFNRSDTATFAGVISGGGAVEQIGSGTTVLTAASSYNGATSVLAGALVVNGSIALSSGLTVAPGALVGGTGVLPSAVINGTLAPGNSIGTVTVVGNLAFGPSGVYLVEVGTTAADRTNVTGVASLNGTVRVLPGGGPLVLGTQYTIINALGGVTGTFASVDNLLGAALQPTLSYDANNVYLTLAPGSFATSGTGLTVNQTSVATALDRAVAAGADTTPLTPLYLLPAAALGGALDQLTGEVHTSAQSLGVLVSGEFLRVLLNRSLPGRRPNASTALAYAPAGGLAGMPAVVAATEAADVAAGVDVASARRFQLWATAMGSDGRVGGDGAIGSARLSQRSREIAAGVDIHLAPDMYVGFALAGGSAHAALSEGLGSASAEVFQAGGFAMTRLYGVDLSGALTYSRLNVDTSRAIPVLDVSQINASYDIEVWGGRVEAALPQEFAGLSIAPLAALQVQSVRMPAFVESAPAGGFGALSVSGSTVNTIRTELGARFEARFGLGGREATAFARFAWAHYFERQSSVTAAFVDLPEARFTVIGARPDRDAALVSTGIEMRLTEQLSLGAQFDGEFSEHMSQYSGTARIRFEF